MNNLGWRIKSGVGEETISGQGELSGPKRAFFISHEAPGHSPPLGLFPLFSSGNPSFPVSAVIRRCNPHCLCNRKIKPQGSI